MRTNAKFKAEPLQLLIQYASTGERNHYNHLKKLVQKSPEKYWGNLASHFVWEQPYTQLFKKNKNIGTHSWFYGGKVNYIKSLFKNKNPDAEAWVVYTKSGSRKSYTYRQLQNRIQRLAGGLSKKGVTHKKTTLIYVEDQEQAALCALACLYLGSTFGFIYSKFPKTMTDLILKKYQPDFLVWDPKLKKNKNYFPSISQLPRSTHSIPLSESLYEEKILLKPIAVDSTHSSFILFTSGTTATPKAFLSGTAGCHIASLVCGSLFFTKNSADNPKLTHWSPLDFAWGATLILGFLGPLYLGLKLVFDHEKFRIDSSKVYKIIKNEGVSSILLAPVFLEKIKSSTHPMPVKKVVFGGDRMSSLAFRGCKYLFPSKNTKIINIYGSNECGSITLLTFLNLAYEKSCNQMIPVPGIEYKLVKSKNKIHELWFKNNYPSFSIGVKNNKKIYKSMWSKSNRYLKTQDLVTPYKNQLTMMGRQGNLIKIKGRYIDLSYYERKMAQIKGVTRVYLHYTKTTPSALTLFIETQNKNLKATQFKNIIIQNIGAYGLPKNIIILKNFPKATSGKINTALLLKQNENKIFK